MVAAVMTLLLGRSVFLCSCVPTFLRSPDITALESAQARYVSRENYDKHRHTHSKERVWEVSLDLASLVVGEWTRSTLSLRPWDGLTDHRASAAFAFESENRRLSL